MSLLNKSLLGGSALVLLSLLPCAASAQDANTLHRAQRQPPARVGESRPPERVTENLSSRPRQQIEISERGPAPVTRQARQAAGDAPAPRRDAPPRVYTRDGRVVAGAVQAGPNRVFVPGSGRYYLTRPYGDGQEIVRGD